MTLGHAFPGYWASEDAHNEFKAVKQSGAGESGQQSRRSQPWVTTPDNYTEIKRFIDEEKLIPIETVSLTTNTGFEAAWLEACDYFGEKNNQEAAGIGEFETMIDVLLARPYVTPLPFKMES